MSVNRSLSKSGGMALAVAVLQFLVFKHFYPSASYFQDSYSYIYAAMQRDLVSYRPVGYSWFLIATHAVIASETFLVTVQYALLVGAVIYLSSSIADIYRVGRMARCVILWTLVLNPLLLYTANMVSSDALFMSLTMVWLAELLWLLRSPSWWRIGLQAILVLGLFFTRFNALWLPPVIVVTLLLTRRPPVFKIAGIAAVIVVMALGVIFVREMSWRKVGVRTFSPFSGWQMANNALMVYPYIRLAPGELPGAAIRELDSLVRLSPSRRSVDTWYMWDPHSPLKRYMYLVADREGLDYFAAWSKVGPVFSRYGYYLMMHHPLLYVEKYYWPSAQSFFCPQLEELGKFNEGHDTVDAVAKDWFHLSSVQVSCVPGPLWQGKALAIFPPMCLVVYLGFVGLAGWGLCTGRLGRGLAGGSLVALTYMIVNAGFSIFASPTILRYQLAPTTFLFVMAVTIIARWNRGPGDSRG